MKHISKVGLLSSVLIITILMSACDNQQLVTEDKQPTDISTEVVKDKSTKDTVIKDKIITDTLAKGKGVTKTVIDTTANKAIQQANSFANIYSTTCMKYLNNLDKLREKLAVLPELPKQKAKFFLKDMMQGGSAYPVPDKHGVFVLALSTSKNVCAVYAKTVDVQAVQQQFTITFAQAPKPLVVKQIDNQSQKTKTGEQTITAYEWYQQGAKRKMVFMLSTDSADDAEVQALFTASIVH